MNRVRIVIFAKAPQPGFAKTRLIPVLGAQGAANLAQQLLNNTVQAACAADADSVELCVTPAASDPMWQALRQAIPDQVLWTEQGDGDLGTRMARAAERVIDNGESMLLIGTDCPELTAGLLSEAVTALHSADATLIPVSDGGYVLLGLNRFHPSLFDAIAWSTESVAEETRCRLARLGWSLHQHPALHDIDEPADLKWLRHPFLVVSHA